MNDISTRSAELAVRPRVSHVERRATTGDRAGESGEATGAASAATRSGNSLPPELATPRVEVTAEESQVTVEQAVARLNDYVQSLQRDIRFSIDPESKQPVVRVVERDTQEVIRQIPNETALQLARSLKELEGVRDLDIRGSVLSDISLIRAQA